MTDQFNLYAQYYDLLYQGKNYGSEAKYISDLIKKYHPDTNTILNLGCGTGKHDIALTNLGYEMTGVDLSEEMVTIAKENGKKSNQRISFQQGDIRNLHLNQKFDAIISLFHVMSYQTKNEDLLNVFDTVYRHLKSGGIFIFDCWYGPGVLTDLPVVRIKRLENENLKIIRLAEPVLHPNENVVDVNYTISFESQNKPETSIHECHKMRYLFLPEIENMLLQSNLKFEDSYDWMKLREPLMKSWYACFVCRK